MQPIKSSSEGLISEKLKDEIMQSWKNIISKHDDASNLIDLFPLEGKLTIS